MQPGVSFSVSCGKSESRVDTEHNTLALPSLPGNISPNIHVPPTGCSN